METFGSLWMILLLGVYYVSTEDNNCTFPSYAQNEPSDDTDYWEFNDGISRDPVVMTFHRDEWIAISEGDAIINSTCVKQQGSENSTDSWSDIFITKGNMGDESLGSMCLQFINRTNNVVQIKTAKAVDSDGNFTCNSTLELVDRPLLANKRRTIHYQRCPFEGGYNLYNLATITGKNEEALCGDYPIQGLLESECTIGEGLQLIFTDKTCIPKYTGWGPEQLLYCLDSWKNENETQFSVLGSTYDNPEFCMMMIDDQFVIFQDMICPDGVPPNTTTYITMDYVKKEKSFDICEDEEDMVDCTKTELCQHLPFKLSCRNSCEACYPNDTCQYDESTVPQEGQWVMQRDVELHSLVSATFEFQPSTFNVEEFTQFNCHKKVLDDTYLNHLNVSQGCSSRYACTKFSRVSPSVLQYKFSRFERDYEETTDLCQDNNFNDDDEPLKNIIRSRDYNILIAQNESLLNETVDCSFYGNYTFNMSLHMDTISCTGSLSDLQHCEHHDTLSVEVLCGEHNHTEEYPCIGTIDFGRTSTRVLITRAPKDHSTVGHCWVLKSPEDETSPLQFYVLNSPQCDVSTLDSIETGTRHAEANVTAHRVDTCDEPPKSGTSTTTKGVPDDATSHSTVFITEVDENAPIKGPDYGPSAGTVIGILFGVIAGCLLVSVAAWFGVREYRKRKSPYRVL